jgi:hypothetical protein
MAGTDVVNGYGFNAQDVNMSKIPMQIAGRLASIDDENNTIKRDKIGDYLSGKYIPKGQNEINT